MRSRITMYAVLTIVTQLLWSGWAEAALYPQPPAVSPFNMTGFIQAATLDLTGFAGDVLAGGTVTVNGTTITIPRNTIVIMSGSNISWQELWAFAPCPWGLPNNPSPAPFACANGNGQTGLALSDRASGNPPLTTYEVTIAGNRIVDPADGQDKYVAGLVFMAQHALNIAQGFINCIDYGTGELHVGPALTPAPAGQPCSTSDARIQINDPAGRFGRLMSPDPRWTADTDNPTIRSKSAYPMCIPRAIPPPAVLPGAVAPAETDPLCPQKNRPLDPVSGTTPLGNFTLCNPGAFAAGTCRANTPPPVVGIINAVATVVPDSDATNQAPFQVGDYIEYSGTLQQDSRGQYMSAWQIIGNVGIFTSPDSVPAYVAQEVILIGVGGTPITAPIPVPQESTTRIKTVGFFTDPTRTVDLFAVVMDPCTGAPTDSLMLQGIPQDKGAVPWGRFRQVDQQGLFDITRQWRVRYTPIFTDPPGPVIAANGLEVMQFTAPVPLYITPENTIYGDPTLLVVPQNFQNFPFLTKGEGPWRGNPANIVGTLQPFPLTNSIPGLFPGAPAPWTCPPNQAPVVVITPATQTVAQNTTVRLDASKSSNPLTGDSTGLAFLWVQKSGPTVTLSNADTSIATFKAPNVTANTALTFEVTVANTAASSSATTLIEVTPQKLPADSVTITAAVYRTNRGVLNVSATSSDITCSAILTLSAFNGTTPVPIDGATSVTMVKGGPVVGGCGYNYTSGRTVFPAPTSVQVKSSLGGAATSVVTVK